MTRLSVNINKVALVRNARGSNFPDLVQFAKDCETYGAQGITVHPRPDERHIRYADIPLLKEVVTTEFNIEGNPTPRFMEMVLANCPHQCTLVPDEPDALTSDGGWDTITHAAFLKDVIGQLKAKGIRVSLFMDTEEDLIRGAKEVGADRIEFYTGTFAKNYSKDPAAAIADHVASARLANSLGLGVNAGHDLNLENLEYYQKELDNLLEVSIGHALVVDAWYYGLKNTIQMYLRRLK